MKAITDWINSHKVLTVCIAFFLLIVQPFLVHVVLLIPAPYKFMITDLKDGELLTYVAGFEAFLGTVFLGIVAVRQNDKANETSERVLKLEEDSCFFTHFPNVVISGGKIEKATFLDHANKELLVYTHEVDFDLLKAYREFKDKSFFIIRFSIQNLSVFNIRVKLESLYFEATNNHEISFKYKSKPINYKPAKAVIAPNNDLGIGFLVEDVPELNVTIEGVMHLVVSNSLNEEYLYTIEFEGLIDTATPALFVLDQYDAKFKQN